MRFAPMIPALLPLLFAITPAAPSLAQAGTAPHVATDIAPIHSLVAQVMQGVGTPDLILPPGASPHGYAMRPSEAAALAKADLVVWVGPDLTPWLEKPLDTIAAGAARLTLSTSDLTHQLALRETAVFSGEDHEDEHEDEHEGEHEHEDEHKDEHEGEDGHDDHDHGHQDPHVWLDPVNAQMWLTLISDQLAKQDPDHAQTYRENAAQAQAELDVLIQELRTELAPDAQSALQFVVFHDAYQHFENRFGLTAAGAISLGDASRPSPARIKALRDKVQEGQITCALAEPQFNPGLITTVFEGTDVATQVIDPIGTMLTPGPDLYAELLRGMAKSFVDCTK